MKPCPTHPERGDVQWTSTLTPSPGGGLRVEIVPACIECFADRRTQAHCHCGSQADADRGRGMCLVCDDIRCDAYPGECPKVQIRRRAALAQLRDARKRMEQAEPDAHGDYYAAQREYAAAWDYLGGTQ